jgi:hypothetical protein
MGSDSTWLYDLTKSLERRDRKGIHVIPEFLAELVSRHRSVLDPGEVAREVFGGLMRSNFPRPEFGRLRGHARVLLYIDDPQWVTRFVLATPLYVEISPPNLVRGWRRVTRKRDR